MDNTVRCFSTMKHTKRYPCFSKFLSSLSLYNIYGDTSDISDKLLHISYITRLPFLFSSYCEGGCIKYSSSSSISSSLESESFSPSSSSSSSWSLLLLL